jgi:site-specific recombinase XerD
MSLEPLQPSKAKRLYEESRVDELASRTLDLQRRHISEFVEWCEEESMDNMNDISARTVHEFKLAIKGDIGQRTLSLRIGTVRTFLRFCEGIDAVKGGTAERIILPKRTNNARDEMLDPDMAERILDYLRRFEYGSRRHALITLLWQTGIRTGTVRTLDIQDFEQEERRLRIRHRPESGTPLKNSEAAERYLALREETVAVLADYVDVNRPEVQDDHGRDPLLATPYGRISRSTVKHTVYGVTRPCIYSDGCPHDRDPLECDAAKSVNKAHSCPTTLSAHSIRRGSITHHLREDVPEKVVSDRMNVSQDVLDDHYDRRTDEEKTEQRRKFLSNV